ncbi:MAG: hypothetical protein ACD_39C01700G0002 [uncultured bacterium]|nr:MAG: hypothetical protein ACD_39C01700G0002 [uncultured bacterium]
MCSVWANLAGMLPNVFLIRTGLARPPIYQSQDYENIPTAMGCRNRARQQLSTETHDLCDV